LDLSSTESLLVGQQEGQGSTHQFNGPISRTAQVSRCQEGKTNLDFTEERDSEWQWHQLGHMQVCTLLQTENHASTPPLSLLQAGCPSCRPTNSVKALKALSNPSQTMQNISGAVTRPDPTITVATYYQYDTKDNQPVNRRRS